MAEATLHVDLREKRGKQYVKRMRHDGLIPGILYGRDKDPEPLTIDGKELLNILHTYGRNAVVNLNIGKSRKKVKTFIYEIQHNPLSGLIIHVDLKHISLDEKIHVTVPIHLTGTPESVKNEGGIVEHILHTLEIRCRPANIPEAIVLDISHLHIGDGIHVRDIPQEKYDVLSESERILVHIITPRVGVAAAEGAPAEGELEIIKEPEVITRKLEEE